MKISYILFLLLLIATDCFGGEYRNITKSGLRSNATISVKDASHDPSGYVSYYTSLKNKDCSKQIESLNMYFRGAEYVFECPAPKGWKLYKVYEHEGRSWLIIAHGGSIWSTIDHVWNDPKYCFGGFPSIETSRVEWRLSKKGVPAALIFRVTAIDPETSVQDRKRFFVVSLVGKEPTFCGMSATKQEARKIADRAVSCPSSLMKEST